MVSHPILRNAVAVAVMGQDGLLPLAETVQRFVSVMVDLQVRLPEDKIQSERTVKRAYRAKPYDAAQNMLLTCCLVFVQYRLTSHQSSMHLCSNLLYHIVSYHIVMYRIVSHRIVSFRNIS